jgi:thiol-disulfide isomerase/thioredoxin
VEIDVFNRVVSLAAVLLAVLVVLLAAQNFRLKRQLAEHDQAPLGGLEIGERLGPVELLGPAGESRPLTFSSEQPRTVLLFFTPSCPACRATIPVWLELIEAIETPARILGVNLGGPEASAGEELVTGGWPFPVFGVEPEQSSGLHRITHVPATVILDGTGTVRKVWFGELGEDQQADLRRELRGG